jgi:hypothetical protein
MPLDLQRQASDIGRDLGRQLSMTLPLRRHCGILIKFCADEIRLHKHWPALRPIATDNAARLCPSSDTARPDDGPFNTDISPGARSRPPATPAG